jgi:hypothetical protein
MTQAEVTKIRRVNPKRPPFKVGDRVRSLYELDCGQDRVYTVSWISKGTPNNRRDQLIATEYNGYCNPASTAACYTEVE